MEGKTLNKEQGAKAQDDSLDFTVDVQLTDLSFSSKWYILTYDSKDLIVIHLNHHIMANTFYTHRKHKKTPQNGNKYGLIKCISSSKLWIHTSKWNFVAILTGFENKNKKICL